MTAVLWIDDEIRFLRDSRQILQNRGVDVTFAADACSAIAHLQGRGKSFDFYLVDVDLRRGSLETDYPELELALPSSSLLGLNFVRLLTDPSGPFQVNPRAVVICSSHAVEYLYQIDSALMARTLYLDKGSAFISPDDFVDQVLGLLGEHQQDLRDLHQLEQSGPSRRRVSHAEGLSHDYRNLILPCLSTMRAIADRLQTLLSGTSDQTPGHIKLLAGKGWEYADRALDILADKGKANTAYFDKASQSNQQLKEELSRFNVGKITLISGLLSEVSLSLSKLPPCEYTLLLASVCRDITIHLCVSDIETMTKRLSAGLVFGSDSTPESAERINTSEVVTEAIDLNRVPAQNSRLTFRMKIEPNLIISRGDRAALLRVLINLIENAVKYSGKMRRGDAWIEVRHYMKDGRINTEVESWGPEVPEAERNMIIGGGYRARGATRPGNGQGMAIVNDQMQKLGGEVQMFSLPRQDSRRGFVRTVFRISLAQNVCANVTLEDTAGT